MTEQQREQCLNDFKAEIYTKVADLNVCFALSAEPVPYERISELSFRPLAVGEKWGELWDCAWFRVTGELPQDIAPKDAALILDVAGEGCIYIDGVPTRGITNVDSEYDRKLGLPGKRVVLFTELALTHTVEFYVDCGCNDLFGNYQSGLLNRAEIAVCDFAKRALYYDLWVLDDYVRTGSAPPNVVDACETAFSALAARDLQYVKQAVRGAYTGNAEGEYTACGHSHLDLAWLWPIRETYRKAARTFSTFLRMCERYPEYKAGFSQPQQFEWIRQQQPKLFKQLQTAVRSGRLEPQGAMWVEADLNTTGGESLIRQLIEGRAYFNKYFGVKPDVAHLPDVFGYIGSLPQILLGCGVNKFLTTKLSWNRYTVFPHTTFIWKGIDGSCVTAHLPPEGVYNSAAAPRSLVKAQACNVEKEITKHALMLFGIGDGGGGAGPEHLERLRRLDGLSGLPTVRIGTEADFFKKLESDRVALPVYEGELYLEKHQGTYTTRLDNKLHNRYCEKLLLYIDYLSAAAYLRGELLPDLTELRREVLLYQFHDILPGSCIDRVYAECQPRYAEIEMRLLETAEALASDAVKEIRPARAKLSDCSATFAADGTIAADGAFGRFNTWALYADDGDAWDYGDRYKQKRVGSFALESVERGEDCVRLTFGYHRSKIVQTVYVEGQTIRSDCEVDWREERLLLVNEFDLRIAPQYADCGIQFGNIRRPVVKTTPQETAMTEFCAPRYVDLSDGQTGAAVISELFGYSVDANKLYMHVLRNAVHPSTFADTGVHRFSFAVYPHTGDYAVAGTPFVAELFFGKTDGLFDVEGSVIVSAVKPADDGSGIVIRIYEPCGTRATGKIVPRFAFDSVYETTLDERVTADSDGRFTLEPFQIKTFLFCTKGEEHEQH